MNGIILKNVNVYAPEPLGIRDIFIFDRKIVKIEKPGAASDFSSLPISLGAVNGSGMVAVPGIVDGHVHFNGAGGEGGPLYRTPPTALSELTAAGITTAAGLLGTDGFTRSLRDLLMKARSLSAEGITAKIYTGAYQLPGPFLTTDTASDIILVDEVVGLKIAFSDHRSSHASLQTLREAVSQARAGGILAGKKGAVMVHIGEGPERLRPLEEAISGTDIPITQFIPTHLNRSARVLGEAAEWAKKGGYVDLSAGVSARHGFSSAVDPSRAVRFLLDTGAREGQITMSSDGNGVMTVTDPATGKARPLVSPIKALYEEFAVMIRDGIPAETAVRIVSTNPADRLGLSQKGRIGEGMDGDVLLIREDNLELDTVVAGGKIMVREGRAVQKGLFEK